MVAAKALRDQIGVVEFVAFDVADRLEADREGSQAALALCRKQRDQHGAVEPAREQHADRHVGDAPPLDRIAESVKDRLLPIGFAEPRSAARGPTSSCQNVSSRRLPSGSMVQIVAGGSLRTPLTIVIGAGTTACKLM